jgi:hypothetical protein
VLIAPKVTTAVVAQTLLSQQVFAPMAIIALEDPLFLTSSLHNQAITVLLGRFNKLHALLKSTTLSMPRKHV